MADEPTTPDTPAEPDKEQPATPPATPPTPTKDDGKDELPPELKTILDKERRAAREADKARKAAETELNKLRETQMSEHEKAVKAARDEGLNEGMTKGNQRLLRAEVLAASAGKVADPEDVYAILSSTGALSEFTIGENGEVDTSGLKLVIDDLVKAKPHLAASRAPEFGTRTPAAPPGNGDAGMDAWLRAQAGRR